MPFFFCEVAHSYPDRDFLLLLVITLLFAAFYDPYLEIGPEILEKSVLEKNLSGWSTSGKVTFDRLGGVCLQTHESGKRTTLSQVWEPGRFVTCVCPENCGSETSKQDTRDGGKSNQPNYSATTLWQAAN